MAKRVTRIAKLQFMAGQAKPGPELAGLGIDMGKFTKDFNDATKDRINNVVPVIITAYSDRTYDFVLKTTPAANMIMKAANIEKGASEQNEPIATISKDEIKKIAEYKLPDLNTSDIEQAIKIIEGTARNMGVVVLGMTPLKKKKTKIKEKLKEEKIDDKIINNDSSNVEKNLDENAKVGDN